MWPAFSWGLGAYRFNRYKQDQVTEKAQLVIPSDVIVTAAQRYLRAVALVRYLINTPAGDMMPQQLAETVESLGRAFNAEVTQIIGDEPLSRN